MPKKLGRPSWISGVGCGAGLERYEAAFRENEIDDTVLPTLTAEDLKDLGVDIVGHRRKLLNAIALLRRSTTTKASPPEVQSKSSAPQPDAAERRQVTVMFSDLVGSTALSARMDPEDLREVISAYQKCVAETVQRFGGFVAKYMGDGVLVYFGYPQAHEDDAERAVRAGLKLIAAVAALKTRAAAPNPRRHRDWAGRRWRPDRSGAAQEQAIVGETPNLAARLQRVCRAEQRCHRRKHPKAASASCSIFSDLGPQELKGIAEPQRAWAALRPSAAGEPLRSAARDGLTAARRARRGTGPVAVGAGRKAKTGEGRVVLISGEPVSASRAWPPLSTKRPRTSHARACAGSARRTIRTARFIPQSFSSKAPLVSRAMMTAKQSGPSCASCSMARMPTSSS